MAIRRKRKDQQQEQQDARDASLDLPPCAGAADVPGQPEPSAEAEGAHEPELDEALARRLAE
jgi:hypothetical protein